MQRQKTRIASICVLLGLVSSTLTAQVTSSWWYPQGSPEGTRRALGTDQVTAASMLTVKWRTTRLSGAQTILVGALGSSTVLQQIVGTMSDTLITLDAKGDVMVRRPYQQLFPTPIRLMLAGLVDPQNGGLFTAGKPRFVALGIERESMGPTDSLWAFLADTAGNPIKQLKIAPPAASTAANRRAALIPIATYQTAGNEPAVLATLSQPMFRPSGTDSVANGLLRFEIAGHGLFETGRLRERYPIAPCPDIAHPALLFDPASLLHYAILSTRTYDFSPPVQVMPDPAPPVNGAPTSTDHPCSIDLVDSAGRLSNVETVPLPLPPAPPAGGHVRSHAATLFNSPVSGGEYFRVIVHNYSSTDPGVPTILLKRAFSAGASDLGSFADPAIRNVGYRIAACNLDGETTNSGLPERQQFPNNAGDELVAAQQREDDADIADNHLEVFRWNERDGNVLTRFASQSFDGRLLAAGDLVMDQYDRQEVVVSAGDSVSILQLLPYKDPSFGALNANYLRVVHVFKLDGRVTAAAIADIDGDGGNDLVVTTERATWALGLRQPAAFGVLTPSQTSVCRGDSITLRWNRRVGGGEAGVDVSLLGSWGGIDVILNRSSGIGPDSVTIATSDVPEGTYRFVVSDRAVRSVSDTSTPFSIFDRSISSFVLDAPTPRFGDRVRFQGAVHCVDDLVLEVMLGNGEWTTPSTLSLERVDSGVTGSFDIECSEEWRCPTVDSVALRLRLRSPNGEVVSDTLVLSIPLLKRPIRLAPGDTSLSRDRILTFAPADFVCPSVAVHVSNDGLNWRRLPDATRDSGRYTLSVPDEFSGRIKVRLCCESGPVTSCEFGLVSMEVSKLGEGDYIAPNPFDPTHPQTEAGARVVYNLVRGGSVTVSVFDASRTLVRRLVDGVDEPSGRHVVHWDGRNEAGRIVANGAYICLVESSLGDRIVLPFYVLKRR